MTDVALPSHVILVHVLSLQSRVCPFVTGVWRAHPCQAESSHSQWNPGRLCSALPCNTRPPQVAGFEVRYFRQTVFLLLLPLMLMTVVAFVVM
jgi:hypothetical protein